MKQTYAYYPGCSLDSSAKEYDRSAQLVCRALDLELRPMKGWTCCGASSAHATSRLLATSLSARNLHLAAADNLPIVTPCPACFARLKSAGMALKDAPLREAVQDILEADLSSSVAIYNLAEVLAEPDLDLPVKRPLSGLKVACYYGCLLVRPRDFTGSDDPENPHFMDGLMERLGAEAVEWPLKSECCGASLIFPKPDIVLSLSRRILEMAVKRGADCLVVACPLCHSNLDMRQREMAAQFGETKPLPIVYFTQLMGIALGLAPQELGLERHFVDPRPILKARGLV